jgi:hypothetical protein
MPTLPACSSSSPTCTEPLLMKSSTVLAPCTSAGNTTTGAISWSTQPLPWFQAYLGLVVSPGGGHYMVVELQRWSAWTQPHSFASLPRLGSGSRSVSITCSSTGHGLPFACSHTTGGSGGVIFFASRR